MRKRFALLCILLAVLSVGVLYAQNGAVVAILEYFDNDAEIEVLDSTGTPVDDIYYGLELMIGDTVQTNGSMAEIRIEGNGSILKLAKNTVFTIVNLQNTGNPVTEFTVITGKLRTIAARTTSGQQQYLVNTPTAVCGVRGTDFTVDVAKGKKNALIVKSGLVEYINTATGQSLSLGAGMLADTFAATFQAIKLTAEQLAERPAFDYAASRFG